PAHGIFPVIAADPAIGTEGMVGLRVGRLPDPLLAQHCASTTTQFMTQCWTARTDRKQTAPHVVARLEEFVKLSQPPDERLKHSIADIGRQITRRIVIDDVQPELPITG